MASITGSFSSMSARGFGLFSYKSQADYWSNKPVIAVTDETSATAANITSAWKSFRQQFPKRPFYLLWPANPQYPGGAVTVLKIPTEFISDPLAFGPKTNIVPNPPYQVNRDQGNPLNASDWFNICDLGSLTGDDRNVTLWVDGSGSMSTSTVAASISLMETNMTNAGIPFVRNPATPGLSYWSTDLNSNTGLDEIWPIPYISLYPPIRPWGAADSPPPVSSPTVPTVTKTIFIAPNPVFPAIGRTWKIPTDYVQGTPITFIVIGAGGDGGSLTMRGGGGGACAYSVNSSLLPGQGVYVYVGLGEQTNTGEVIKDTWVNFSKNSPPTSASDGCLAKGGANGDTGGMGGSYSLSVGQYRAKGGDGGASSGKAGGGGGSSAGTSHAGYDGGPSYVTTYPAYGGGGGGSGGPGFPGSSTAAGLGGRASNGVPSSTTRGNALHDVNNTIESYTDGGGGVGGGGSMAANSSYPGGGGSYPGGGGGGGAGGGDTAPARGGLGLEGVILVTYTAKA